jgi:UDPglucose 6-dehydrogenase
VVLVTDWQEYRDLPWIELAKVTRKPLLLDGRNFLSRSVIEEAGFRYVAFGT